MVTSSLADLSPGGISPRNRRAYVVIVLTLTCLGLATSDVRADLLSKLRETLAPAPQTPHPAVVRIYAYEDEAASGGSGSLIHVDEQAGYVISNWHVVRDAVDAVEVIFPDGFRSPAKVLKMDQDWDLALLSVQRPQVAPIPLADQVPQLGELLTIAGYGGGPYRAARGTCAQFVSPAPHLPFEMIEVSVSARQGDSGGPILNQQGQLAAVLFGTGQGMTTGSHVGRVQAFLQEAFASAGLLQNEDGNSAQRTASVRVAAVPPPFHPRRTVSATPQNPQSLAAASPSLTRGPQQTMVPIPPGPPAEQCVHPRLTDAPVGAQAAELPTRLQSSAGPGVVNPLAPVGDMSDAGEFDTIDNHGEDAPVESQLQSDPVESAEFAPDTAAFDTAASDTAASDAFAPEAAFSPAPDEAATTNTLAPHTATPEESPSYPMTSDPPSYAPAFSAPGGVGRVASLSPTPVFLPEPYAGAETFEPLTLDHLAGQTTWEKLKSFMALIGVVTIGYRLLHLGSS